MSSAEKNVRIQYFAILREQRGLREELIQTHACTAGELYRELKDRHHFSLPAHLVKVSINLEVRPMDAPISDGDQIVFIPPVAGG